MGNDCAGGSRAHESVGACVLVFVFMRLFVRVPVCACIRVGGCLCVCVYVCVGACVLGCAGVCLCEGRGGFGSPEVAGTRFGYSFFDALVGVPGSWVPQNCFTPDAHFCDQ